MSNLFIKDKTSLDVRTLKIVDRILREHPDVKEIFESSETILEARFKLRKWVVVYLDKNINTKNYYLKKAKGHSALRKISYKDYAAIRLMDYLDNEGRSFEDPHKQMHEVTSNPVKNLWLAINHGKGSASVDFFLDMYYLLNQLSGKLSRRKSSKEQITAWMHKHPSGLEDEMVKIRQQNKERIIKTIISKIDSGEMKSSRFSFEKGLSPDEKFEKASEWWNDYRFHLVFAVRDPDQVNEMLDFSLREKNMKKLYNASKKGIPIFVNPYYLSLISVDIQPSQTGADLALRDYIFPSKELINEFGNINAWEKEDKVLPGQPNAAGWMLPPYRNVHRRYPEVAIFIPDTVGRACGGLCVSCQRMYDFQSGHFNFNLKSLKPTETWPERLKRLLKYWEDDTQLRDILITGGDALMSTDTSLKKILDEVFEMALRKKNANKKRAIGSKYAEIVRVRIGSRLLAYIPQRVTPELITILREFKEKASKIGIKQFVIQTHIQSAMEITPEVERAVSLLLSAGWLVTNQLVFTASSSRRGHTAKLRKVMGEIGIVPYYTFSVKGFMENYHNFATNERAAQERVEEKYSGNLSQQGYKELYNMCEEPEKLKERLRLLIKKEAIPFLAIDRTVMNLPGVGKSLSYRTIGITDDGRRILEFSYDPERNHSPITSSMGNVIIIESKSIKSFLDQMTKFGEDVEEYKTIWGYSSSETEKRPSIYNYPPYDYPVTKQFSNLVLDSEFFPENDLHYTGKLNSELQSN